MVRTQARAVLILGVAAVVVVGGSTTIAALRADEAPAAQSLAVSPFLPATSALGAPSAAPWVRPDDPTARAARAGLRMLGTEGTALHLHAHLSITIDGQDETVPGEIGIDDAAGTVSPLHTHDETGIIHVESPVQADFSLAQFFTEWNVALDADRIGSYTESSTETFTVFVNQQPFTGNPASLVFTNKMDIELVLAPAGQAVTPAAPFDWPEQY